MLLIAAVLYTGCTEKVTEKRTITVENPLDIQRSFETVEIDLSFISDEGKTDATSKAYGIVDAETQKKLISQSVDSDGDGIVDKLLFQPEIEAKAKRSFELVKVEDSTEGASIPFCYSRFVPERTDDYAWENNRVAFRTYGPTAQKMVEDKVKGGTLSSGIDAWLKRVDYPIIDKWYKKELETDGSYHEDTGEGLDNFHVGPSRGVGGTAVKADTNYYTSKNFTAWKHLYNGPIRTSFILTYADWDAAGDKISEEKHISLDYGSNLTRFEINIQGTDTISAGVTLHEKEGEIEVDADLGWISYWEPHEGSELGTGIVVPNGYMMGHEQYESNEKDKSNLFARIKLADNSRAIYYAGFGWKKSGLFDNKEEWNEYLGQFAEKVNNPLIVEVQ